MKPAYLLEHDVYLLLALSAFMIISNRIHGTAQAAHNAVVKLGVLAVAALGAEEGVALVVVDGPKGGGDNVVDYSYCHLD